MAPAELLDLAHFFSNPANDLCILAEGNVSCHAGEGTFWIKASGVQMGSMDDIGFVEVDENALLSVFGQSDVDERSTLNSARIDKQAAQVPSTEAYMHADLLGLDGVKFVGHGHPPALLSLLILSDAQELAGRRWFPDEVVCCGPAACYVPYVAPGLALAMAIRSAVEKYRQKWTTWPKTIWLQNHGLICLGSTASEVKAAAMMSVKAARVVLDALQTKRELTPMSPGQVRHIHTWPDEHYRQQMLREGNSPP